MHFLMSWMAEHSKQSMNAWMKNNCSCSESITVTICIFSCISVLDPGLWSGHGNAAQMPCISSAPLMALPAWHLSGVPLPGSQDYGEILTVIYIFSWGINDSFPPCSCGFILGFGVLVWFFFPFSKGNSALPQWCWVPYKLSQSPYPWYGGTPWGSPWSCSASSSFCKCRWCSVYKLEKVGPGRMPAAEKRLKSVPVGAVLHLCSQKLRLAHREALFLQHKTDLWLQSVWPWLASWSSNFF